MHMETMKPGTDCLRYAKTTRILFSSLAMQSAPLYYDFFPSENWTEGLLPQPRQGLGRKIADAFRSLSCPGVSSQPDCLEYCDSTDQGC